MTMAQRTRTPPAQIDVQDIATEARFGEVYVHCEEGNFDRALRIFTRYELTPGQKAVVGARLYLWWKRVAEASGVRPMLRKKIVQLSGSNNVNAQRAQRLIIHAETDDAASQLLRLIEQGRATIPGRYTHALPDSPYRRSPVVPLRSPVVREIENKPKPKPVPVRHRPSSAGRFLRDLAEGRDPKALAREEHDAVARKMFAMILRDYDKNMPWAIQLSARLGGIEVVQRVSRF